MNDVTRLPGNTLIRPARDSDTPAMARVFVDSWRSAYPGLLPDRVLTGMSDSRISSNFKNQITASGAGYINLVAENEAFGIVGLVQGGPVRDCGLEQLNVKIEAEIYTLYVAPDAQGFGVGRLLLKHVFGAFATVGYKSAVAWMISGNNVRYFYEHFGATLIAHRRAREWGRSVVLEAYAWPSLGAHPKPMTSRNTLL